MGTVEPVTNLMSLDLPFNVRSFFIAESISMTVTSLIVEGVWVTVWKLRLSGVVGEAESAPGRWDGGCMFLAGAFCQSNFLGIAIRYKF